jgi:hypothetical protein
VGLKRSAKESKHAGEKWINPVFESRMRVPVATIDGEILELQSFCAHLDAALDLNGERCRRKLFG